MKKLMIPLVIAIAAGLGGGSAFSFVNAKNASKAAAAHVADSLQKHVQDSTVVADSLATEVKAMEVAARAEEALMTPADSIRSAQSQPASLKAATKELTNAVEPTNGAGIGTHAPATVTRGGVVPPGKPAALHAPDAARAPMPGTNTIGKGLTDSRIAKIFSAMQSKDAAKVLEQMSDNDIRVILTLMGDKQAAAILVALPAPRAAAISKGVAVKAETKTDGKPETKPDAKTDVKHDPKADVKSDSTSHQKKPVGESL